MRIDEDEFGEPIFQKRRQRFDDARQPRELTFSCYHQFPFLSKDRTRQWFIEAVRDQRTKWPIDLWAYVIMPEHVHLLVAPREAGVEVGRFGGWIKAAVALKAIAWMEQYAPNWIPRITVQEGDIVRRRFWQPGGGFDRNVEQERTLLSMIEYIHHNPVRRGLVLRAEDWEWSSARWYAGLLPVHLEMDRTLPMFTDS